MRAVVIRESLADAHVLTRLRASVSDTYAFELAGEPVEIVELEVSDEQVLSVARALAEALRPARYYAHLSGPELVIVAFPGVLAFVRRGDSESARRAQCVGSVFQIPASQMRFSELFERDHPERSVASERPSEPA